MTPVLLGAIAGALLIAWAKRRDGIYWPAAMLAIGAAVSLLPIESRIPGLVLGLLLAVPNPGPSDWTRLLSFALFVVGFVSGGRGAPGGSFGLLESWGLDPATAEAIVKGLRKVVHFTAYGALAAIATLAVPNRAREAASFGLVAALIVATFDEGRQGLVGSRTGSAWDVLLDGAGAVAGTLVLRKLTNRRRLSS